MNKTNIKNKDVSRNICKNSNTYISLLTQSNKKTNHNSTVYHNYKAYVKKKYKLIYKITTQTLIKSISY